MADFSRRAPRCVLVNVSTGESMECQFNPAKLVEKVSVGWSRLTVPGLGRQIVQFQSTGDREFPSVEFWLDRTVPDAPDTADFVAFLRSLTVPETPAEGAAAASPPRCLLLWPGVMSVEAVVTSLEIEFRRMSSEDGTPVQCVATVSFEEVAAASPTSAERRKA